ncbi:hypothetical protein ACIBI9_17940 [Nonomuraea sp. NPDC050451]|uniref:hypothetical protein n=1 Tax=Nonomuraea sp. NPDC050451 TaxID=3364364 RepID=UPI0037BAAF18
MSVPRRSPSLIWTGRIVFALGVAGLVGYFAAVGLEKADRLGSVISCLVALGALVAPYLLPPAPASSSQETAEPPNGHGIDLRHAQGVQINQSGGNSQHNNFSS